MFKFSRDTFTYDVYYAIGYMAKAYVDGEFIEI